MSSHWIEPVRPSLPSRIKTEAGGHRMSDEEYNRKWFARLMKRTTFNERGCFVWTGPVGHKGYIMMTHRDYKCSGHRIVYILSNKIDLAREQQVCHRCDDRRCWNPAHLFLGTNEDNARDMAAKKRHHLNRKTCCIHGHEFTPENTRLSVDKNGDKHRTCKTCERERQRRAWHEKPARRAKQLELRAIRRGEAPPKETRWYSKQQFPERFGTECKVVGRPAHRVILVEFPDGLRAEAKALAVRRPKGYSSPQEPKP